MTLKSWARRSVEIHDRAFEHGDAAARLFLSLTDDPGDVAKSLACKWDDLPEWFLLRIIPISLPQLPKSLSRFDRSTAQEVHLEALFEGVLSRLEIEAEGTA